MFSVFFTRVLYVNHVIFESVNNFFFRYCFKGFCLWDVEVAKSRHFFFQKELSRFEELLDKSILRTLMDLNPKNTPLISFGY